MSVDGTDFSMYEPAPFNSKWYSHKLHGPGLKYDVEISIESGHIVWIHGPWPCGEFSDLKNFTLVMKGALQWGENVIADKGYKDERCITPLNVSD